MYKRKCKTLVNMNIFHIRYTITNTGITSTNNYSKDRLKTMGK